MPIELNLKETIFKIKPLGDGKVAVIDKRSTVRFIDVRTMDIVDGFKTKLLHDHRLLNIVDISNSGKLALIGIPGNNKAALFLAKEKLLKAQVGLHQGDIETVSISPNEEYLATGGMDGRSFVYHASTATILLALPPHRDYVTAITFDESNSIVATGSFDKLIIVKNIATMGDPYTLMGHFGSIKKILFLSKDQIVAADKVGGIIIWDLQKRAIKVRLKNMMNEILDICITKDKRFLFATTVLGEIGLYDLEKFEQLTPNYIKITGRINAVCVVEEAKLLVHDTQEGHIQTHSLIEGEEKLIEAYKEGDFEKAYACIHQNLLLTFSEHYKLLEETWETRLHQAQEYLARDLKDEAEILLAPFSNVPGKRTIVKNTMQDFVEFGKFKTYIDTERYALAYGLANKYKVYQDTKEYLELEALWEKQFTRAKRSILERTGDEKARELLQLFRGVSDKALLINELYKQRKVYILFRNKLAQKDFLAIFSLAKNYPFLTHMKEFKDVLAWGDKVYIQINHFFENRDFISAIKYAEAIKDFPDFKEEMRTIVEHSAVYLELEQYLQANDIKKIYKMLADYPFLSDLPIVDGIDAQWMLVESQIQRPVSQGNIKKLLEILDDYLEVKYKRNLIIMLLKSTYIRQIEIAMKKEIAPSKIKAAIQKLYTIFGQDELFVILNNRLSKITNDFVNFDKLIAGDPVLIHFNKLPTNIFLG